MKTTTTITALTGLNLALNAALSLGAQAAPLDQPATHDTESGPARQDVMQVRTQEFETSFLKVAGPCKSSHAAFDAVSVGLENVPAEIRLIHAEVESA